ncbi:MAG: hypothetical protein RH945_04820 [Hyphomonas sp.]|tara:strand:- start:1261 stop:1557 length:297 start_codon:yes stop_codon:yes gene_type:complete
MRGKGRSNKLLPEVKIDTPLRNIAGACADIVRCTKAGDGCHPKMLRLIHLHRVRASASAKCFKGMEADGFGCTTQETFATIGLPRSSIGTGASFPSGH